MHLRGVYTDVAVAEAFNYRMPLLRHRPQARAVEDFRILANDAERRFNLPLSARTSSPTRRRRTRRVSNTSGIQIARFKRRALARSNAQGVLEIGFEIAVLGPDRIERHRKIRCFNRNQHRFDVVGHVDAARRRRVHSIETIGQEIIVDDEILRNT
jgi:hypothetical protein